MAKKNIETQSAISKAWEKTKGAIGDKIYDCKVKLHASLSKNKKVKKMNMSSKAKRDILFYVLMMAYPVAYFLFFYVAININSLLLAFKNYEVDASNRYHTIWIGFENFKTIFSVYANKTDLKIALGNSLLVYLYNLLTIPLGLLFSFYIAKKSFGHNFFKVMLFLPSILSSLILVIMFKYVVERLYPAIMLDLFGQKDVQGLLANTETRWGTLVFYNILVSFGTSVLIYSSTMDRIPDSILESAKLEGISGIQEFWYITLPLIFPTISTFLIVGIAGIFTNQYNIFSLYGASPPTNDMYTLGFYLFAQTVNATDFDYPLLSAYGILYTAFTIPLTFLLRYVLERFGSKGAEF